MPPLHRRDRDEPDRTEVRLGSMPALRSLAQMGLSGLQKEPLGRRAPVRLRIPPGVLRAIAAAFRGRPERVPQLRPGAVRSSTWIACRSLPRTLPARNGVSKIKAEAGGYRQGPACLRDSTVGWPAGVRPRGHRGMEPAGRPGIARYSGSLVRFVEGLAPCRGIGCEGPEAGKDRCSRCPGPVPSEPGHRCGPARGSCRVETHAARHPHVT